MKQTLHIDKLRLWDKNPRYIEKEAYSSLLNKIKRWGQFKPVISTPDGEVIGGNMRLRAYRELGINDIWVSIVEPKSEAEKLEIAIADNESSGRWQEEHLAEYLSQFRDEIKLSDYQIDLGNPTSLDELLDKYGPEPVEDDVPEVSDDPAVSQLGEVYQLGRHRLMCGDSTKIEDVEKLMDGERAEMLFTSPPYIDMREYEGDKNLDIVHLKTFIPTYIPFCNYQVVNLGLKFDDGQVIPYWQDYLDEAKSSGLKLLAWNVWDKTQAGSIAQATNMFFLTHEWIFVFGTKPKDLHRTIPNNIDAYVARHGEDWQSGIGKKSVRQADGSMMNTTSSTYTHHQLHSVIQQTPELSPVRKDHPAVYPVGLPSKYIEAMTDTKDIVIDCFLGSGSTLIACEQTNRTCYGMELDPKYCDVIRKRYAKFMGQEEEWETVTPRI